jgi:uncharacterized membrane protein YtjA (UPF0391 family)
MIRPRPTSLNLRPSLALRNSSPPMLTYAIIFLLVALAAGALGFGGIAGTAASIAQILFVIFLVLFIVSLLRRKKV